MSQDRGSDPDERATIGSTRIFSVDETFATGDPYPHYAWFRHHDPVHFGAPGWPIDLPQVVLFRHADVSQWLRDPRLVRRASQIPEFRELRAQEPWQEPQPDTFGFVASRMMLFQDPPDHTRLRGLANRAFTPRVVSGWRDEVTTLAHDLLQGLIDRNAGDLISTFAYPLPVLVIARMLGIPGEDTPRFREWSAILAAGIDVDLDNLAEFTARVDDTTHEVCSYLRAIIMKRRRDPADDLISRLVSAHDEGGRLDDDELVSMCVMLMLAGHETTVNLIANGTLALMRHPDQWKRLRAEPSLAKRATRELLRYDSPVQMTTRLTAEDVEIGGKPVPRGTALFFMLGSANRDEYVWDDPDQVLVQRDVGRHMSFGMGIHFCLGSPLAELEGEIAFHALATRVPALELVDPDPTWRPGAAFHGLKRLDVRAG